MCESNETKKCLQDKGQMCSCHALDSKDIMARVAHVGENMRTTDWELDYTTLHRPEIRRLCVVGVCQQCGGRICVSLSPDDSAYGDDLLAMMYRHLWQYHHATSQHMSTALFREMFATMFHEQDQAFIREWLERPENQSVQRMYRRCHREHTGERRMWRASTNDEQPVQLYTITRNGIDIEKAQFPASSVEENVFPRERV